MQAADSRISSVSVGSALVLPVVYVHFFSERFFYGHFAGLAPPAQNIYQFSGALLLFSVVPLLTIMFFFKRSPAEFGLARGNILLSLKYIGSAVVLLPLFLYLGSKNPEMRIEYPLYKGACAGLSAFLLWELFYLIYYFAWEFYFRGFLLFGAAKSLPAFHAIAIQCIPSILLHIGKPAPELFASIPAGILFGAIALHTRSILAPLAIHYYAGILNDLFCCQS